MRHQLSAAMLCLVCVVLSGCGQNATAPSANADPFVGEWRGTITDDALGGGTLTLSLAKDPLGIVTGSWSAAVASVTVSGRAVAILAPGQTALTGPTLGFTCLPGVGTLGSSVAVSGNRITGTYSALTCGGLTVGTIDLTKQ
jgi:hypothetical protein